MLQFCIETTTLCSGLVLPLIYFTNPLTITITQDLKQITLRETEANNNSIILDQTGLITSLSKGISAYESWLEKEEENAANLALEELLDTYKKESLNFYEDYLLNKEEYLAGAKLFYKLGRARVIASSKSHSKRIRPTRLSRAKSRKGSRFSLFNRYNS
jgi:hypothetical protein